MLDQTAEDAIAKSASEQGQESGNVKSVLRLGDSEEVLREYPDESVDCVVCDPPYAIQFMGLDFDKALPSVSLWKQVIRVMKPGAFAFVMSAPRADVLSGMIGQLQKAGFRVDFSPLYWTFASGFP